MNVYRITMVNNRLNFRKILHVQASTCAEAVRQARSLLAYQGYDYLESAVLYEALG